MLCNSPHETIVDNFLKNASEDINSRNNLMKCFKVLIICLTLSSCSFDNKTGIWENNDNPKESNDLFKEFKKKKLVIKNADKFGDNWNDILESDDKKIVNEY